MNECRKEVQGKDRKHMMTYIIISDSQGRGANIIYSHINHGEGTSINQKASPQGSHSI